MALRVSTPDDYEQQGYKLLPPGPAWKNPDGLIQAIAEAMSRTHNRLLDLLDEADPRTTDELLPDWERVAGLPDPCVVEGIQSTGERIASLVTKLTMLGGQSPAYFIALAGELGHLNATITEYREYSVDDDVDAAINGPEWAFAWLITGTDAVSFEFTVNDSVDDPLASWSNAPLECLIDRYKPAHTYVLFAYS